LKSGAQICLRRVEKYERGEKREIKIVKYEACKLVLEEIAMRSREAGNGSWNLDGVLNECEATNFLDEAFEIEFYCF
jgi:hypothetical protein